MCLLLLAAGLVVLVATGAWLWFNYRPRAASAWPTVRTGAHSTSWVRTAHRFTGDVVVLLALSTLVLLIGMRVRAGGRGLLAGAALAVCALAASLTGYLLPWDQVALHAVKAGTEMRGVSSIFDDRIAFVLIGPRAVSPSPYRFWAIAHVVLGLLVGIAGVLSSLRARASGSGGSDGEAVPRPGHSETTAAAG